MPAASARSPTPAPTLLTARARYSFHCVWTSKSQTNFSLRGAAVDDCRPWVFCARSFSSSTDVADPRRHETLIASLPPDLLTRCICSKILSLPPHLDRSTYSEFKFAFLIATPEGGRHHCSSRNAICIMGVS